jgi:hypothetical protein
MRAQYRLSCWRKAAGWRQTIVNLVNRRGLEALVCMMQHDLHLALRPRYDDVGRAIRVHVRDCDGARRRSDGDNARRGYRRHRTGNGICKNAGKNRKESKCSTTQMDSSPGNEALA